MLKRFLSVLLIINITFAVFATINFSVSAATVTTAYIEAENVRVRTGPSLVHSIIEEISYRNATVLDSVPEGEYTWYQITYHNGTEQITGYIRGADYIRIVTYNPDATFEEKLKSFPESYREALRQLKSVYKNWEFIPDPVNITFDEAVALETIGMRKQVSFNSQPISWRSMGQGCYDWNNDAWIITNGGWTGASREIAAYYMDPRNFLNTTEVYQFLQQGYDPNYQNEAGVNLIIAGTFMATNYSDPKDTAYGGSYAKVIMEAAKQAGVSPYILASKIRQEIGTAVTSMVSGTTAGYVGYYNFYNIGASGADAAQTLKNGLERAKSEGWNTRSAAIIGGAKFLSNNYISKGQDTYYYQDFNIHQPDKIYHQYAQAIHDAVSKGKLLSKSYMDNIDFALTFKIPVYTNMPESVSPKPVSNSNKNNYYFLDIVADGLTPTFSMFTYNYNLSVSDDAKISVFLPDTASYVSANSFNLAKGNNIVELVVKAETGYCTTYTLNIFADIQCVLNVAVNECVNHCFIEKSNKFLKSYANCVTPTIYYYECSECGEMGDSTYTYGSALGHDFSLEWTVDKEATYYEEGIKSRHCSRCSEVIDVITIPRISVVDGVCGDNVLWSLYLDGTLELTGDGETYNFGTAEEVPWYEYSNEIKEVKIADGITNIGHYSFNSLSNLKSVTVCGKQTNFSPYYVFNKDTTAVIYGQSGSVAESYAVRNNMDFIPTDIIIPNAPIISSVSGNTVTLEEKAGYEYSSDGIVWQKNNVFNNVPYDEVQHFYQRFAATDTVIASPKSNTTKCIIVSAPKVLVGATTLKFTKIDGYKYSVNGIKYQTDALFSELVPKWNYTVYHEPINTEGIYVFKENNKAVFCTNGNDIIDNPNSTHLVWLRKILLEANSINLAADINEDSLIDVRDLINLKKRAAGF